MSDYEILSDHNGSLTAVCGAGQLPPVPAPAMRLFDVLGRRWSAHLLYLLSHRPARFTELQAAVPGLSATSLNDRLRYLINAGLVTRHVDPGPPLTSSYQATHTGQQIRQHLHHMLTGTKNLP